VKRESTLTYEEFVTFTASDKCHYCWSPIAWSEFDIAKNGTRYNLDRKDNSRGYDVDNLVVCCKDCNAAKGSRYDYETWFAMTEVLRNRKRGKAL
jgi:5-methylcytosine-specific restriction endonuclease McrA